MLQRLKSGAGEALSLAKSGAVVRWALGLALVCAVMFGFGGAEVLAEGNGDLIPDTETDVSEYVTAAISALAGVVGVAVGGYFAFLIIRMGLRWARRIAG